MSVQEEKLTAIADAIRFKEGSNAIIPAPDFPARIRAIQTGVDTSDGTAVAGDILSGKIAYAKGQKLVGTIPSVSGSTITPGTSRKTAVASGRYTTGAVYVSGDTNLVAGNIKSGVSIFGVAGTLKSPTQFYADGNGNRINIDVSGLPYSFKINGNLPNFFNVGIRLVYINSSNYAVYGSAYVENAGALAAALYVDTTPISQISINFTNNGDSVTFSFSSALPNFSSLSSLSGYWW